MTDTPDPQQAAAAAQQVKTKIMAQYVRDLSFENVLAQKAITGDVTPEISVQVNLDGRKRANQENQFEVVTKLVVTSKT